MSTDGGWTLGRFDPYISDGESIRCKDCAVEVAWVELEGPFPHREDCPRAAKVR